MSYAQRPSVKLNDGMYMPIKGGATVSHSIAVRAVGVEHGTPMAEAIPSVPSVIYRNLNLT